MAKITEQTPEMEWAEADQVFAWAGTETVNSSLVERMFPQRFIFAACSSLMSMHLLRLFVTHTVPQSPHFRFVPSILYAEPLLFLRARFFQACQEIFGLGSRHHLGVEVL